MPTFRYTASDAQGVWRTGEAEGAGRAEVEARFRADGWIVESLREADAEPVEVVEATVGGALTRREVAELVGQLEALTRSGLPLPSGLRAAGEELDSPRLRAVFLDLAARVEAGQGLDQALGSAAVRYPPHVRGLIVAGGRSGRLAEVLGEYVRAANTGEDLRRRFWRVVAYPLFALVVMTMISLFVCHLAVILLDELEDDLSVYRSFWSKNSPRANTGGSGLMLLARFIDHRGLGVLLLGMLAGGAAWLATRWALGPARYRGLLGSIPVFGPLLRFSALAEFCHLLSMLLEAEVPLPEALTMAGSGVRDAELAQTCARMGRLVAAGHPLSRAVVAWPKVPAGLGELFGWSETARNLPGALRMAGDMFDARARSQAAFSGNVVATLLTLLILWWVGFALAVIYLPLINTISRLSG